MFYEARLNNIQKFIERDLNDLEVCHDVMIKGKILAHDATAKQDNMENVSSTASKTRVRCSVTTASRDAQLLVRQCYADGFCNLYSITTMNKYDII